MTFHWVSVNDDPMIAPTRVRYRRKSRATECRRRRQCVTEPKRCRPSGGGWGPPRMGGATPESAVKIFVIVTAAPTSSGGCSERTLPLLGKHVSSLAAERSHVHGGEPGGLGDGVQLLQAGLVPDEVVLNTRNE